VILLVLNYNISDELKYKIKKISKKDISLKKVLYKKIKEIIDSNEKSILHYKFLKHDIQRRQRVHIKKHFVLIFKYFNEKKLVLFLDFDNHSKIYKS
jgi:mRNA-degrading endonuclease RelE of RelBE toxin-antitoxin system